MSIVVWLATPPGGSRPRVGAVTEVMVWLASLGDRPLQVQRLDADFGTLIRALMPSPAHRGQRVLVVDDDVEFGTAASLLLVASGYEVVGQPGTAADGLSAALALRPDVVLLDISLPDGNGFDVAKQLTELENPAALIMISTRENFGFSEAAFESGARGFLPKSKFSIAGIRTLLDGIAPDGRCGTDG